MRHEISSMRALRLCWLLAGCIGGQTGQENSDTGREPPAECEEQPRALLDDEVSPLGESALQVADAVAGPFEAPLSWDHRGTRTRVVIAISYAGGSARFVSGEECPAEILLDVSLRLTTDDGLLDEEVAGTLHASGTGDASFAASVPLTGLAGSYDASEFDLRNWRNPALSVHMHLVGGTTSGMLSIEGGDPNPKDKSIPVSGAAASW